MRVGIMDAEIIGLSGQQRRGAVGDQNWQADAIGGIRQQLPVIRIETGRRVGLVEEQVHRQGG